MSSEENITSKKKTFKKNTLKRAAQSRALAAMSKEVKRPNAEEAEELEEAYSKEEEEPSSRPSIIMAVMLIGGLGLVGYKFYNSHPPERRDSTTGPVKKKRIPQKARLESF